MVEIKGGIPNAIIIWLKTGEKIVFIDKERQMQIHELKIAPRYFEAVENGKKSLNIAKMIETIKLEI